MGFLLISIRKNTSFFRILLVHHEPPTQCQQIWATIGHCCLPTIHRQRMVMSNVHTIGQVLAEMFGGIGGRHVVQLEFGGIVACVPLDKKN